MQALDHSLVLPVFEPRILEVNVMLEDMHLSCTTPFQNGHFVGTHQQLGHNHHKGHGTQLQTGQLVTGITFVSQFPRSAPLDH